MNPKLRLNIFSMIGALFASLLALAPVLAQPRLDLKKPDDAVKAMQKTQCSLESGKAAFFWWKGSVYSRVPGERDRHLFNVEGMNVRACQSLKDDKRGHGYRMVSREILLYLDPVTNQVLRQWKNPFTAQTNDVIQIANDPVNNPPSYALSADGKPYQFASTVKNGRIWTQLEIPLFYKNPLGGEYQDYVGGTYHAMEMFTFFMHEEELLDAAKTSSDDVTVSWARTSEWLPWMEMGDRPGTLIFSAIGRRVAAFEDLSPLMKAEIKANYPAYTAPPALDDARPNETSWTYFKKILAAKKNGQAIPGTNSPKVAITPESLPATKAGQLDLTKPADLIKLERKLKCSVTDGKTALAWWHGKVFSRVPGERDRLLFNVHAVNVSACQSVSDTRRGAGFRQVSRDILIFTDPATGQVLRTWKNPWTNETVEVMPEALDPLNTNEPTFALTASGKPKSIGDFRFLKDGKLLMGGDAVRSHQPNPMGGDFQSNIGGWLHSLEFGTSEIPLAELLDANATESYDRVMTRVRVSKWLPWMKMGDRAGVVVLHTGGMRLRSWEEVPDLIRAEIEQNWPLWREAPPLNDARPSVNAWDQFKRWLDAKKKP